MLAVPDQFVQSTQSLLSNGQSGLLCDIGLKKKPDFRKVFQRKVLEKEKIEKAVPRLHHIHLSHESTS